MTVAALRRILKSFPDNALVSGTCRLYEGTRLVYFDVLYVYDYDDPLTCCLTNVPWDDGAS